MQCDIVSTNHVSHGNLQSGVLTVHPTQQCYVQYIHHIMNGNRVAYEIFTYEQKN